MSTLALTLPGWQGSGPQHWQSIWERLDARVQRVEQASWTSPDRGVWTAAVLAAVDAAKEPVILVGHSLGAVLAVHVAPLHASIAGALLVAPPGLGAAPVELASFAEVSRVRLSVPSIVVASSDDPWLTVEHAQHLAADWGSSFVDVGPRGHLNAESGLGSWREGWALLQQLRSGLPFRLDERLRREALVIGRGELCELLLFDDARYPWVILVPRKSGAEHRADLSTAERLTLELDSAVVEQALLSSFPIDKVNVGALGNVVRQLHVHHVGRALTDPAWPGPVWGHSPREPMSAELVRERVERLFSSPGLAARFERQRS